MTAAIKYRLRAESRKYEDDYRLDILEEDYTGALQLKSIGAGRLRLKKNKGVIQYTTLTISIQADSNFEYLGFFQYNNRKYPVKLYKNDVLTWSGYIVAESYSEPYQNPPYDVTIVATDNLSFLENYKFSNSGMQSKLDAIRHCIDNLGLQLNYAIAIDLFEENMVTTRAMLNQNYLNGDIFEDEDCETVIKQLLPYGAIITQHQNRWLIRRPFEDAEKTHFVYDYEGNYTGTLAGETQLSMGDYANGGIWPHTPAPLLNMQHAWDDATIIKDYGKRASFLQNYNFSKGDLSNWTNATNADVFIKKIDETYFAQIEGYSSNNDLYIEQGGIDVEQTAEGDGFAFEIKAGLFGYRKDSGTNVIRSIESSVFIMVKLIGAGNTYYLTEEGWITTAAKISIDVKTSMGTTDFSELKIMTDSIPDSGNMIVRLYRKSYTASGTPFYELNFLGSYFTDVKAYTFNVLELDSTEEVPITIREDAADVNEKITLKPVDLPDVANARLLLANGSYYLNAGSYLLTRFWNNNGGNALLFDDLLEAQLINYYGQPRQKLTGCDWRGAGMHLNAVASHAANYNRVFIADSGVWEIIDDVWNVVWVEKPDTATDNAPWILEDGIWGDSGEIWIDTETWEDSDENLIVIELTSSDSPDGYFNINDETGISNGDTINSLPSQNLFGDKLYEDGTEISSTPHTFTGTNLRYNVSLFQSESYQTSFEMTIGGVEKTIQMVVTI